MALINKSFCSSMMFNLRISINLSKSIARTFYISFTNVKFLSSDTLIRSSPWLVSLSNTKSLSRPEMQKQKNEKGFDGRGLSLSLSSSFE